MKLGRIAEARDAYGELRAMPSLDDKGRALIDEELKQLNSEINPTILEHNRMAAKVMAEYRIPINDFYSVLVDKNNLVRPDGVHWDGPAMKLLGEMAVGSVLRELGNPAQIQ